MPTIIAGRFIGQDEAAAAMERLVQAGFDRDEIALFFVNAPGQHDRFPIGGDEDESPGTEKAGPGAVAGAGGVGAALGLAAAPVLGPVGAMAGAAVGAYVGSLVGALNKLPPDEDKGDTHLPREPRKSGVLVAVAAPTSPQRASAIELLRAAGAEEVEYAEGEIRGGDWTDFDPLAPVVFV